MSTPAPPLHLLVTGLGGTVGSALAQAARAAGHRVTGWDRAQADPLRPETHADWIAQVAPEAIVHLALASVPTGAPDEGRRINLDWTFALADIAAELGCPFVYTSTALVFDNSVSGPFTLASPANAQEGYGLEKRQAEHGVLLRHPEGARIVRLGWQIAPGLHGNQMAAHAAREMAQHGRIAASQAWRPACSLVDDTAQALLRALASPAGLYMADSNQAGWNYVQILRALAAARGHDFQIAVNDDYRYDQRLVDPRLGLPDLAQRLPALGAAP